MPALLSARVDTTASPSRPLTLTSRKSPEPSIVLTVLGSTRVVDRQVTPPLEDWANSIWLPLRVVMDSQPRESWRITPVGLNGRRTRSHVRVDGLRRAASAP